MRFEDIDSLRYSSDLKKDFKYYFNDINEKNNDLKIKDLSIFIETYNLFFEDNKEIAKYLVKA